MGASSHSLLSKLTSSLGGCHSRVQSGPNQTSWPESKEHFPAPLTWQNLNVGGTRCNSPWSPALIPLHRTVQDIKNASVQALCFAGSRADLCARRAAHSLIKMPRSAVVIIAFQ